MNTTETTSTPTAYCQACGRPLAANEVRNVGGNVFCEPCLASRVTPPNAPPVAPYAYQGPNPGRHSPVIAGLLGMIPGVGAMYNGQFIKGIVHVLIFVALIGATDHFAPLGIAIAVWYVYMIFDAVQTAQAIRMGLPLPDPMGLNTIGARLGIPNQPGAGPVAPPAGAHGYTAPVYPAPGYTPPAASGSAPATPPPVSLTAFHGAVPPPVDPIPPVPPIPPHPVDRGIPTGAVVLIGLGAFFALGTFGVFSEHWMSHGWPVLLIALGAWLLFRNQLRGGSQ